MTIAELIVKIGADASQFARQMEVTKQQVATVGRAMESFGRTATYAVTLPMVGLAGAMIKASATMEQTRIAMTTMTGSAEKAGVMLKQIQQLAIETPFGLQELTTATRQLLAYNFACDKAVSMLRTVGDASAALGQGSFGMERIIRALGQMQAKGRVTAQEMNQLAEVGINGFQMIAEASGRTTQEIMKLSEKGMLDAATGVSAILSGINRQFGGAMAAQNKTLAGQWERLVDTAKMTMRSFGDAVMPIAKGIVQSLGNSLKEVSDRFAAMNIHEKNATMAMYAMIAAIPPMVMMIGKLIGVLASLKLAGLGVFAVGGPIAVGVAALAGLIYVLTKRWLEHKTALGAFNNTASATTQMLRGMSEEQVRLAYKVAWASKVKTDAALAMARSRMSTAKGAMESNLGDPNSDAAQQARRDFKAAQDEIARLQILKTQRDAALAETTRALGANFVSGIGGPQGLLEIGGGLAPGLGCGAAPEMTAAQKREAEAMMERARLEAYTAYARSQIAGVHVSKAPGIWGLERWSAKPEPERVLTEREKRIRVARVLQDETVEKMEVTGAAAERFQSQFDGYVGSFTNWTNGFLEISDRMGNIASSIAMNWQNAGQIITNALRQMVAQLVGAIAKAMVFKALMTMFGIPTGGKGDLTFGGIIKSAFGFAEGGIVTKPTLALIGEKREPEAVIPLSKMGQFGGGTQTINIVLDGQVIASAVTNRQAKEVRMRGMLAA